MLTNHYTKTCRCPVSTPITLLDCMPDTAHLPLSFNINYFLDAHLNIEGRWIPVATSPAPHPVCTRLAEG